MRKTPKDDSPRKKKIKDGVRFEVAELLDGRYQFTIELPNALLQHISSDLVGMRTRINIDCDQRDKVELDGVIDGLENP